ncbi:glycoside hydrolase family 10 protein [Gelatoporia subvermispora B]|uniref:Beta-xylanase n=1 Tax=Ceriporiopsis subvermispora (strain B) TaxID=914234 RepID=M2QAI7_CERS8|nr:glycoside hydrolase family 10 protein [Gelatoporia subvermispora B]
MQLSHSFAVLLAVIPIVVAQSAVWGQCGGIGWTGPTTCDSGSSCVVSNPYYSQCLPGAGSAPSSTASPPSPTNSAGLPGSTSTVNGLNALAKTQGKLYLGTATDNPELTDTAYTTILDNNMMFGQLTPANSMKWDATEPEPGTFTFTEGDQIADLAQTNGQLLRGHNCVWYNQLPSWVTSTTWNATGLTAAIERHVSTVVGHYKGIPSSSDQLPTQANLPFQSPDAWDVVNEPFNDDGTFRSDVFYDTLGESYITIALNAARAADPNAKLYINDYNIEGTGVKSTAMQNLIQSLKAAGTPIDGVGIESHLIVGEVPTTMQENLEAITALGVEVAITELDIRMTLPETAALLEQQKSDYQTVISTCMAVEKCVGMTLWDFTDKYSWVPSTFSGQGDACPWDENLVRKPAYDGIVAGLQS